MDVQRARDRISDELQRVEQLISSVERDLESQDEERFGDPSLPGGRTADGGMESTERERVFAVRTALESERDELRAALGRVDAGTYGVDEETGERISEERLDAVPAARTAVRPQRRSP